MHGNLVRCAHPAKKEEDNNDPAACLSQLEVRLAEEAIARCWLAAQLQGQEARLLEMEGGGGNNNLATCIEQLGVCARCEVTARR